MTECHMVPVVTSLHGKNDLNFDSAVKNNFQLSWSGPLKCRVCLKSLSSVRLTPKALNKLS